MLDIGGLISRWFVSEEYDGAVLVALAEHVSGGRRALSAGDALVRSPRRSSGV